MKRRNLIQHIESHGCRFLREGGDHAIYINTSTGATSGVPRHREIKRFLARKICRDLQIAPPSSLS